MNNKPYAKAVRIYENADGTIMADIKTNMPPEGLKMETITWTMPNERERFYYNGYTLFYDERIAKTELFEDIRY